MQIPGGLYGIAPGADGKFDLIIETRDPHVRERVKAALLERSPENRLKADLPIIDGFAVELDGETAKLIPAMQRRVRDMRVFPDREVCVPDGESTSSGELSPAMDVATGTMSVDKVWRKGVTGKGVTIAVIDSGIDPHPDMAGKILAFKDYINGKSSPYDDLGHGTHVSGIAAGTGKASDGKYRGVAPDASLVGLKVLDGDGNGEESDVIQALGWIVENRAKYHIDVVNLSLGTKATQSYREDPMAQAVEKTYAAGIVPVIAAGNAGPFPKTVATPGIALDCITVANLDDRGTLERSDDRISPSSGRGPAPYDDFMKPDVAAPGVNITAPKAGTGKYVEMSGTSMASPFVAGAVALLLQAKPGMAPGAVKELIYATADKLPNVLPAAQGAAGVVDPLEMVTKALPAA